LLSPEDKFIIIASDGVWEFMENDMVAKIVAPFYEKGSPEAAANAIGGYFYGYNHLVKEAYKQWRKQEEVIDDIT
jgi:hypothetical protein